MKKVEADTGLQITISPATIYVPPAGAHQQSMLCDLNVEVKNISSGALSLKTVGIQLPVSLVTSSISPVAGQPAIWDFKAISTKGAYVATQKVPTPLQPQGSFNFILKAAVVHQPIGTVDVVVPIQFDDSKRISHTVYVKKAAATKSIVSFFPTPADMEPGATSVLSWSTTGIDYCTISDAPGEQQPASGTYNVNPNFPQTYTLLAYAPGTVISAQTTVSIIEPAGKIGHEGPNKIDYGQSVKLVWVCNKITEKATITCDDPTIVIPDDLPISGSAIFGPLTSKTTFTLTPSRAGQTVFYTDSTPIIINPPVIKTFTATPDTNVYAKDDVVITWKATSIKTISITPNIPGLPSPLPNSGSITIQPENDINYTLEITGTPGAKNRKKLTVVQKWIDLKVAPVDIIAFNATPGIIIPPLPNQFTLSWDAHGEIITIDQGIGKVDPKGARVIENPVNDTKYTLKTGSKHKPDSITRSVTIVNGYFPFIFKKFEQRGPFAGILISENMDKFKALAESFFTVKLTGVIIEPNLPMRARLLITKDGAYFIIISNVGLPTFTIKWADPAKPSGTIQVTGVSKTNVSFEIPDDIFSHENGE